MKLRWTEAALAHVQAIRDYFARSNSRYAETITRKIIRRAKELTDSPYLGSEVPNYQDESIREVYESPYRIIYRVLEDEIHIIGVFHTSQRLTRTLG